MLQLQHVLAEKGMDRTAIAGSGLRTENTFRVESEEFVMTHKWIGTTRALSLLLSLLLAVGLLQVGAVPASADTVYSFTNAYDCQRNPAFPKKGGSLTASGITLPKKGPNSSAGSYSSEANWVLTSLGAYVSPPSGAGKYFTEIIKSVAAQYGITASQVEIFELTKDGVHIAYGTILARSSAVTVFVGDNWTENKYGCGYLLSTSAITNSSVTVDIEEDTTSSVPAQTHSHTWQASIDGLGTKAVSAAVSCTGSGCNAPMQVDVSLTASDVTLPGNVFGAKLTVETTENPAVALSSTRAVSQPLPGLPDGLEISEPVYKYSATGSGYDPIDPAGFTPKAGYYQASVQIRDVKQNVTVADLAVKYTVSDPAVTAATGDNRPIELMILGMTFFCAMAAGAFVLDGRRKAR